MPATMFAFDRQTARTKDADGRMRVKNCILSTAEVNPYRGREIPGWQKLGLSENAVYDLYRDPGELEKAAHTFDGVPLMLKHVVTTADSPRKEYQCGTVHNVTFDGRHLRGDLMVWDGYAIDLIEADELSDLSCGYRYDPVMQSGEADGSKFDGRMVRIGGNHVALVDEGRASDAHVADAALRNPQSPETQQENHMAFPDQNQEPDNSAPEGNGAPAAPEGNGAPPAAAAPDPSADIGAALKHLCALMEQVLARLPAPAPVAAPAPAAVPGAQDFSLEQGAQVSGMPAPEGATDSEADNGLPLPDDQDGNGARGEPTPHGAMDAKTVQSLVSAAVLAERKRAQGVHEARQAVRGVLGEVLGMDDAGAIYREALVQSGVDVAGIAKGQEKMAWDTYRTVAGHAAGVRPKATAMAMDGAEKAPAYMAHVGKISVKG